MENFKEFVDKKDRRAKKELGILQKVLEKTGMQVSEHLDDDDPYIFVKTPKDQLSFDGIRIYKIGNDIAFRVQKEESTQPYGKAYQLNVEDMFNDLI